MPQVTTTPPSHRFRFLSVGSLAAFVATLAACGGGSGDSGGSTATAADATAATSSGALASSMAATTTAVTTRDAVRLADQATFGPTEALVASIQSQGIAGWVNAQLKLNTSRYTSGNGGAVDQYTGSGGFCDGKDANCWRDWYSSEPLLWDFYRNALNQPDQLRQRVAFALQQILVVSNISVEGTYGFRNYYNDLMTNALGNYRDVLKKVALSPVMGNYLNNANNDKAAPNENFAREFMQLFTIGTCMLNQDGSLQGGACTATYTNDTVRNYAYALTGWTFPVGGATASGCWPPGMNCQYYGGDMVAVASYHDTNARALLSNVTIPAGTAAAPALESVLDSVMAHPNMGPFIGQQLIQHLVSSNPSPAYVGRVAAAFNSGKYGSVGSGVKGDLAATVSAVLLDTEARGSTLARSAGKLREPVLMFTGILRGLNGKTDGDTLSWWWGDDQSEHVFRPPSVFNFYPPSYPVPGTSLLGPEFAIHGAQPALDRLNYLTFLLDWGGSTPDTTIPNAVGTTVDLSAFASSASDAGALVDRLSALALGQSLPAAPRDKVVAAVSLFTAKNDPSNWQTDRIKAAAYLVYGSPNYQVQR